jgi:hypothetical protein
MKTRKRVARNSAVRTRRVAEAPMFVFLVTKEENTISIVGKRKDSAKQKSLSNCRHLADLGGWADEDVVHLQHVK